MATDRYICETNVTIDMVQDVIASNVAVHDAKITEWSAVDIAAGKGFLSVIADIKMKWSVSDDRLPGCVLCKVITHTKLKYLDDGTTADWAVFEASIIQQLPMIHNAEVSTYELLSSTNAQIQIPHIYGSKKLESVDEPAYIIMEDLRQTAGHKDMINMETLNDAQIDEVIVTLARYHAWSIKHLDTIKSIPTKTVVDVFENELAAGKDQMDAAPEMLKKDPWVGVLTDAQVEQMVKLAFNTPEEAEVLSTFHRTHGIGDVLCHGDIHPNNLLFKLDKDSQPNGTLAAIIDFQLVHIGNPCEDLARIVTLCVDREKRDETNERRLLQLYYDSLTNELGKPLSFTMSDLWETYEHAFLCVSRLFLPMTPGFGIMMLETPMPGADPKVAAPRLRRDLQVLIEPTLKRAKKFGVI